jgi:membrane associated rhomboid family serine protease
VTLLLLAGNLAAAFAVIMVPDFVSTYGFKTSDPTVATAFSSLFLHANLLHLLGNMLFLAAVGASVELATGSFRYLLVFFLSGLCGVLAHTFFATGDTEPLIGASGCVAGLIGYYSARYLGLKVPVAPRFSVSVAAVTGVWLVLQVLGMVVHLNADSSVSYWSHLGGLACGLVLSVVFRTPDLGQRTLSRQRLDEMNQSSPALRLEAAKQHLAQHPGDLRGCREWAEAARTMDDSAEETTALIATLRIMPDHAASLARLCDLGCINRFPILERRQIADRIKRNEPDVAATLLRSVLSEPVDCPQRPEALLELIKLRWESNHKEALEYLQELSEKYPHHGALEVVRRMGWKA